MKFFDWAREEHHADEDDDGPFVTAPAKYERNQATKFLQLFHNYKLILLNEYMCHVYGTGLLYY